MEAYVDVMVMDRKMHHFIFLNLNYTLLGFQLQDADLQSW